MDKQFHSQAGQDRAAFEVIGENSYFIDFGCNHPHFHNNTYALEQSGWTGLLVDYDCNMVKLCKAHRSSKNEYISADLTTCDIRKLLKDINAPKNIGYISMDADEANHFIIENFPFDEYNIGFITFEHDRYRLGDGLKTKAAEKLTAAGFKLYKENVVAEGYGEFEDWWVNENFKTND